MIIAVNSVETDQARNACQQVQFAKPSSPASTSKLKAVSPWCSFQSQIFFSMSQLFNLLTHPAHPHNCRRVSKQYISDPSHVPIRHHPALLMLKLTFSFLPLTQAKVFTTSGRLFLMQTAAPMTLMQPKKLQSAESTANWID
jgi:hypothetical protein